MIGCRFFRFVPAILAFAFVIGGLPQGLTSVCHAQNGEDIAKGLLKALIESQLQKSQRRSAGPPESLRPSNGRGVPGHPNVTPQMQSLRPIVAGFSQEMATLSALLQTDSRRNVEIRRLLPDVIRLQAAATALSQRTASEHSHMLVLDDFRNLNSEWSVLSHQLEHCGSLSSQATSCMQRISALDVEYCSILGIRDQLNSPDLTRAVYTLTTYIHDVADDVHDRPVPGATHRQLERDLGQLSQRIEYFATLVSRGSAYSTVVAEYRSIFAEWSRIESALTAYSGAGLSRTVRRMQETHRTIHQLLRIELGIDKNQVLNLVHSIDHEMQELCKRITLEHLVQISDGVAVPSTADAVLGTLQNLDDLVHRDESIQSIGEAWAFADDAWRQFLYYVDPIKDPGVVVGIRGISSAMTSLKQTLGVNIEYDLDSLVSNASSLENHAVRLLAVIKRWQQHPGNHDRNLTSQAESLIAAFHSLEQSLGSRNRHANHRQQCDQAIQIWQQLRPSLKNCDTDERGELEHIIANLTPELVRLSTMVGE